MADDLATALGSVLGAPVERRTRLGGGDVAESYRLSLADGRTVFAKTHRSAPPGFFSTEAAGLRWMGASGSVAVPEVLAVSDGGAGAPNFLALEWIDTGRAGPGTEAELGQSLAGLHGWSGWAGLWDDSEPPSGEQGSSADRTWFGRPDRRTTGSRGLPNEACSTWAEFYSTQRLLPLARLASESSALPRDAVAGLESVAGRLSELGGPEEPASLLHGDLWAGNRLVDSTGASWLIDPAAHGGHREFDLAMMRLFGGYGDACFAAYREVAPLADGWQERVVLHQLAPLVVHAIKFGGGYVAASVDAIERYR